MNTEAPLPFPGKAEMLGSAPATPFPACNTTCAHTQSTNACSAGTPDDLSCKHLSATAGLLFAYFGSGLVEEGLEGDCTAAHPLPRLTFWADLLALRSKGPHRLKSKKGVVASSDPELGGGRGKQQPVAITLEGPSTHGVAAGRKASTLSPPSSFPLFPVQSCKKSFLWLSPEVPVGGIVRQDSSTPSKKVKLHS